MTDSIKNRLTSEFTIDGVTYYTTSLHYDLFWSTWDKLKKPLASIAGSLDNGEAAMVGGIVGALSAQSVMEFTRIFGEYTSYIQDGVEGRLDQKEKIKLHFQDRYAQQVAFLAHCIKLNFSSFFNAKDYMKDIFSPLASSDNH